MRISFFNYRLELKKGSSNGPFLSVNWPLVDLPVAGSKLAFAVLRNGQSSKERIVNSEVLVVQERDNSALIWVDMEELSDEEFVGNWRNYSPPH